MKTIRIKTNCLEGFNEDVCYIMPFLPIKSTWLICCQTFTNMYREKLFSLPSSNLEVSRELIRAVIRFTIKNTYPISFGTNGELSFDAIDSSSFYQNPVFYKCVGTNYWFCAFVSKDIYEQEHTINEFPDDLKRHLKSFSFILSKPYPGEIIVL